VAVPDIGRPLNAQQPLSAFTSSSSYSRQSTNSFIYTIFVSFDTSILLEYTPPNHTINMRFTSTIFAAVALATSVFAQTDGFAAITAPTRDQELTAGSTFTIQWQTGTTPTTEGFTISLIQGATPGTLELGSVIAGTLLAPFIAKVHQLTKIQLA
jgi:hypothetical protein